MPGGQGWAVGVFALWIVMCGFQRPEELMVRHTWQLYAHASVPVMFPKRRIVFLTGGCQGERVISWFAH